ncbi:MAG: CehA/McbA family metallohydrolase [Deltaproteobacteria bacterium]|nr:CehA/McbA family metallohydrolase [Deltaproteobacteria bacterium]
MRRSLLIVLLIAGCGDNVSTCPGTPVPFVDGDPDGHPLPFGAIPGEARAGRVRAEDLPVVLSRLVTWSAGDFVLANDRVALVIEDAGDSDLYDPWGGRPVGLARMQAGRMVDPNNFGELFLMTGRSTIITERVSVIADGSDGGPAIVRTRGRLHPLPFLEPLIAAVFAEPWTDIEAAIDYELAPGADHVDVRYRFTSARGVEKELPSVMHALMYTKRTPAFVPGAGFDDQLTGAPYLALIDDQATSWAYLPGEGTFGSSLAASGFLGAFATGFTMPGCGTLDRLHARLVIGGPGVDGIVAAVARTRGESLRVIAGTVTRTTADGVVPVAGAHVHAIGADAKYLTRATTDAAGAFTAHVAATADVRLEAFVAGEPVGIGTAGTGTSPVAIALPATGAIHVIATEAGAGVPVRVQVRPGPGQSMVDAVPAHYGEARLPGARLHVAFALTGDVTLPVPPGTWEVIVSRGYEYELVRTQVTVAAGTAVVVPAALDRSVATTGVQCADFHIHTWRSNDSGDDALRKVAQAVADGLELPVRSEHEYVADFTAEIAALELAPFAAGFGSIELTSFEAWGHMGVFPLVPDASRTNAGAPRWQTYPTADEPEIAFELLSPPTVFDAVRARPEEPVVIINHPRGGANYFDYVGFDAATGLVDSTSDWDTRFTLVEVLNDASWVDKRRSDVEDWLGLLRAGRKVFAVGSSDSHDLAGTPVGYPRTCIAVGTDDPRQLTKEVMRDQLAAGHSAISGGVYVSATLGTARPGDTTTGAGNPMMVDVVVRAATWIDVDTIEVVVDGETTDMIPIMPGDADPLDATVRWRGSIPVQSAATGGFVVIAAFGDRTLEPVHPGRKPFGMTNPIFIVP